MTETRNERFKRLAIYRTKAVLERIRILGNLSSRTNYDYSEEEVVKIFSAIDSELKMVKVKFSSSKRRDFNL